jgi:dTDP-4-amino-4,6-dideoxy-D-galactose acyltransferase
MIKTLKWDSNFFGIKVGLIKLSSESDLNHFNKYGSSLIKDYKLIYLVTDEHIVVPKTILNKYNGSFINQRIVYNKTLTSTNYNIPDWIIDYKDKTIPNELISLALSSGTFSRFRIDSNFTFEKYEELYSLWIKNSINRKIANGVVVASFREKIKGMITYKYNKQNATIGLLSVDSSEQGLGIGRYLVDKVEELAFNLKHTNIRVATQSNNVSACAFYDKLGLTPIEICNYYHLWIK